MKLYVNLKKCLGISNITSRCACGEEGVKNKSPKQPSPLLLAKAIETRVNIPRKVVKKFLVLLHAFPPKNSASN